MVGSRMPHKWLQDYINASIKTHRAFTSLTRKSNQSVFQVFPRRKPIRPTCDVDTSWRSCPTTSFEVCTRESHKVKSVNCGRNTKRVNTHPTQIKTVSMTWNNWMKTPHKRNRSKKPRK